jgi:hypothetical protein
MGGWLERDFNKPERENANINTQNQLRSNELDIEGQKAAAASALDLARARIAVPAEAQLQGAQGDFYGSEAEKNRALIPGQAAHLGAETGLLQAQSRELAPGIPGLSSLFKLGTTQPSSLTGTGTNNQFAMGTSDIENNYADGAQKIPGKGTGAHDTVHAMLAPGEAVLNKGAAEHVGRGLIAHLNQIGAARMAEQGAPPDGMKGMPPPKKGRNAKPASAKEAKGKPESPPVQETRGPKDLPGEPPRAQMMAASGTEDVNPSQRPARDSEGFAQYTGPGPGPSPTSDTMSALQRAYKTMTLQNIPGYAAGATDTSLDEQAISARKGSPLPGFEDATGRTGMGMIRNYSMGTEEVKPYSMGTEIVKPMQYATANNGRGTSDYGGGAPAPNKPPGFKGMPKYAKGTSKVRKGGRSAQPSPPPMAQMPAPTSNITPELSNQQGSASTTQPDPVMQQLLQVAQP